MKLIDKDALVVEIERRIKRFREEKDSVSIVKTNTYKGILSFLNSLEVKEVDLEKEIKEEYLRRRVYGGRHNMLVILNEPEFTSVAKHFFELGLSINRRDTNWPVIDSMLLEKGIDPYSKEAKLFEERCFAAIDAAIEILKAQKGEKV